MRPEDYDIKTVAAKRATMDTELSNDDRKTMLKNAIKGLSTQEFQAEIELAVNSGKEKVETDLKKRLEDIKRGKETLYEKLKELEGGS